MRLLVELSDADRALLDHVTDHGREDGELGDPGCVDAQDILARLVAHQVRLVFDVRGRGRLELEAPLETLPPPHPFTLRRHGAPRYVGLELVVGCPTCDAEGLRHASAATEEGLVGAVRRAFWDPRCQDCRLRDAVRQAHAVRAADDDARA